MRVVVAPQEFKGSLTSRQAAGAIARGLRRADPTLEVELVPFADGGPGTVEALTTALGGWRETAAVTDPLGRPVEAVWGLLPDGTAVLEMAAASGLHLLRVQEQDPRRACTYGTGQLVRAALHAGCRRLIIGLGGSATNDAGAGMARALGVRFLGPADEPLPPGGAALLRLSRLDASGLDPRLRECQVLAATDVLNPLCGPEGASQVYGPQKGADPAAAEELDRALTHFAEVVERDVGVSVRDAPGAGAAGGLGAALVAFLGAQLRPGAEIVAEATGLAARLERADLAVTGEGRLDRQTAYGKATSVVARLARQAGVPVVALAGGVALGAEPLFDGVYPITPGPLSLEEAMARADELLEEAACRMLRLLETGARWGSRD